MIENFFFLPKREEEQREEWERKSFEMELTGREMFLYAQAVLDLRVFFLLISDSLVRTQNVLRWRKKASLMTMAVVVVGEEILGGEV